MEIQEYLQHRLEEEGTFRAYPVTWTVEEKESGAVAVAIQWAIHSRWHGKEAGGWSEDWAPGYFTESRSWVIGKAIAADPENNIKAAPPAPKAGAIKNLATCGLWDGDWDKLSGPVPSVFCLVEVGSENYQGKGLRYRADWINPNSDEPKGRGGFAPATSESLTSLRARFGSSTRAAAGGAKGTPAAPPTAQPAPAPAVAAAPTVAPTPAPAAAPPTAAPVAAPAASPPTPAVAAPQPAAPAQPPTAAPGGFAGPPAAGTLEDPIDPDDTPF